MSHDADQLVRLSAPIGLLIRTNWSALPYQLVRIINEPFFHSFFQQETSFGKNIAFALKSSKENIIFASGKRINHQWRKQHVYEQTTYTLIE